VQFYREKKYRRIAGLMSGKAATEQGVSICSSGFFCFILGWTKTSG
jgi:hypothetical protein